MKWFKFYGQDWLTDLKVTKMSVEDRLCFITLLCLASSSDNNGVVKNCDEEALIQLTHLYENPYDDNNEVSRARGCLKRYVALRCVTLSDNGDVTVCNFERRQGENLSNAERQKNYRERQKMALNIDKKKINKRNNSNVQRYNDSNARIDKNRIDKNTISMREQVAPVESFNQDSCLQGILKEDKNRHIRLIARFLIERRKRYGTPDFTSKEEINATIPRYVRAAKQVAVFKNEKILEAVGKAFEKVGNETTLETVYKYLTK